MDEDAPLGRSNPVQARSLNLPMMSDSDSQQYPAVVGARPTLRPIPLIAAGTAGFIGSCCVLVGAAQGGSPFALKIPDAWFFGTGTAPSVGGRDRIFLGVIVLYLGLCLMIGAWCEIVRTLRRHRDTPVRLVVAIVGWWAFPVVVMPPLFSHDVYEYAISGEMVSRGLNPFLQGPAALDHDPFLRYGDPIWSNAHAPYGPAWERLAGAIVHFDRHDMLATVVAFRIIALIGVGLIAWGVPVLARSVGRDPAPALALAVLNPAVLLVLLGGAHNDALMLGLLVAGCALARRNHVLVGLLLCALAAEVKVPALIGAVFIGWWWGEGATNFRQRLPRLVGAFLATLAAMVVIGLASGFGWSWLSGFSGPGVVVSWLDPMTALGLSVSHVFSALGSGAHTSAYVQGARAFGLASASAISVMLVLRSTRVGAMQALGWSLLTFVVLGPVVWPWYETWGFVFLAVIAEGLTLRLLMALSAVACFADIPGSHFYEATHPIVAVVCWASLVGAVVVYGKYRLLPSVPRFGRPLSAGSSRWQ